MKRIALFCLALALLTGLSGCNIPTPLPAEGSTSAPAGTTSIPATFTQPAGTMTITPIAPPLPTGTVTLAETPSPLPTFTSLPPTETSSVPTGSITLDLLKNFTYVVESPNTQVVLQNGEYTGDKIHSQLVEPVAFGDLNDDGQSDAAVVLATNLGGSGTFYDLIAVLNQNGTPVQAGYSSFGDRQIVKNLQIAGGRVVLDYITQGLKEAFCCPTEHRLRSYLLDGGTLRLASEQVLDSPTAQATPLPDAILIDRPAMYETITNPLQVSGRVGQVPPEKKLEYYVTDNNAVLLMQGEVPLEGDAGEAGKFNLTIPLDPTPTGIIKVELVDSANGILRGRSMVDLLAP